MPTTVRVDEREMARKELRAKLRKYGLREVSLDETLAAIARLRKTVARVLRSRNSMGKINTSRKSR